MSSAIITVNGKSIEESTEGYLTNFVVTVSSPLTQYGNPLYEYVLLPYVTYKHYTSQNGSPDVITFSDLDASLKNISYKTGNIENNFTVSVSFSYSTNYDYGVNRITEFSILDEDSNMDFFTTPNIKLLIDSGTKYYAAHSIGAPEDANFVKISFNLKTRERLYKTTTTVSADGTQTTTETFTGYGKIEDLGCSVWNQIDKNDTRTSEILDYAVKHSQAYLKSNRYVEINNPNKRDIHVYRNATSATLSFATSKEVPESGDYFPNGSTIIVEGASYTISGNDLEESETVKEINAQYEETLAEIKSNMSELEETLKKEKANIESSQNEKLTELKEQYYGTDEYETIMSNFENLQELDVEIYANNFKDRYKNYKSGHSESDCIELLKTLITSIDSSITDYSEDNLEIVINNYNDSHSVSEVLSLYESLSDTVDEYMEKVSSEKSEYASGESFVLNASSDTSKHVVINIQ